MFQSNFSAFLHQDSVEETHDYNDVSIKIKTQLKRLNSQPYDIVLNQAVDPFNEF